MKDNCYAFNFTFLHLSLLNSFSAMNKMFSKYFIWGKRVFLKRFVFKLKMVFKEQITEFYCSMRNVFKREKYLFICTET